MIRVTFIEQKKEKKEKNTTNTNELRWILHLKTRFLELQIKWSHIYSFLSHSVGCCCWCCCCRCRCCFSLSMRENKLLMHHINIQITFNSHKIAWHYGSFFKCRTKDPLIIVLMQNQHEIGLLCKIVLRNHQH